jgi:16S rRNA G966 N2-methylase RsmD
MKRNPRKQTKRGADLLAQSIEDNGIADVLLVAADGGYIHGHHRAEAIVERFGTDVPVQEIEIDGKTLIVLKHTGIATNESPEARRMAMALNRTGESNEYDPLVLAEYEPAILADYFFPQELLEYLPAPELVDPPAQINKADELQKKWQVVTGDIFEAVGPSGLVHRVMCGDATQDLDKLLAGAKPDLLHTDPPYGVEVVNPARLSNGSGTYGTTVSVNRKSSTGFDAQRTHGKVGGGKIIQSNIYPIIEGDDRPFEPEFLLDLAPVVVLWGGNYCADKLPPSSGWLVWDKRENTYRNDFADCELAWTNQNKAARIFYHLWNGLHKGSQHGQARYHPTEKPVALFAEIGKMLAPGGLWLDLYLGSGAQAVAAEQCGAAFFGMDIAAPYVAVTLERLETLGCKIKKVTQP